MVRTGKATATVLAALATLVPNSATAQGRAEWCPEPEAAQFDFWLGNWDIVNHNSPPGSDQWFETGTATNRVYTVVGGCAVVEHWWGYAFPSAGHIVGFSVRAYDPEARKWELVLLWPIGGPPRFGNPSGTFANGRGDFHNIFPNPQGDTVRSRLSFWDIDHDSFQWTSAISRDNGMSWDSSWIMDQHRRPETATGLWNGMTMTVDRCPGPEYRTFARWLGDWTGVRVTSAGDTVATRTHLVRILEGCAVMERTWAADHSWETFRVRAYEPESEGWVEYEVASNRRRLHRREAERSDGTLVITDVEPVNGTYRRTRWLSEEEGLRRVEEEASSPDGPWRTVWEGAYPARVSGTSGPPLG